MADLDTDRNVKNVITNNVAIDTPGGQLISYTAARGPAVLRGFSVYFSAAGGSVDLELFRSATVYQIKNIAASEFTQCYLVLALGDSVRMRTVTSGGNTADLTLSIEERGPNT